VKYIDVTFREACNIGDFKPDEGHVLETFRRLRESGMDYIEPSYVQSPKGGRSLFWKYSESFIHELAEIFRGTRTKLAAMLVLEDFDSDIFLSPDVDMVRLACTKSNVRTASRQIDYFKSRGLQVAVNLTAINQSSPDECVDAAKRIETDGADIFYAADTTGTMLPEETKRYMSELRSRTNIVLGFHAHDNMGLAGANALEAMNCGAEFIDGSLLGFGKGAGNARTEKMFVLFERLGMPGYSSRDLFPAMKYFFENVCRTISPGDSFAEQYRFVLYALHGVTLATDRKLKALAAQKGLDELDLGAQLVFEFAGDFDALSASLERKAAESPSSSIIASL